jgi:hypothetical protein
MINQNACKDMKETYEEIIVVMPVLGALSQANCCSKHKHCSK